MDKLDQIRTEQRKKEGNKSARKYYFPEPEPGGTIENDVWWWEAIFGDR